MVRKMHQFKKSEAVTGPVSIAEKALIENRSIKIRARVAYTLADLDKTGC
jgi:hypothetical protein